MAQRPGVVAAVIAAVIVMAGAVAAMMVASDSGRGDPTTPPPPDLRPVSTATPTGYAAPRTSSADVVDWTAPEPGSPWQIVLDGRAPLADKKAKIVEVDWQIRHRPVRKMNNRGVYTVCYFSAGTWERWRPDAGDFPTSVRGKTLDHWPGERYLDLRNLDVLLPLWEARIDACAAAGFDAIDPDNIDAYANDSGFDLSPADGAAAFLALADAAHERGLGITLKNSPEIVPDVVSAADLAVVEECIQYSFCGDFAEFVDAGKPVLVVEYRPAMGRKKMCRSDDTDGLSLLLQHLALRKPGVRCPS